MINLMKKHPYKTIIIALVVIAIVIGVLFRTNVAKGALFFTAQPLYNSPATPIVSTSTGVILDGTSTEDTADFTDAASIPVGKTAVPKPIMMSAKAQRIIEIKQQIASLQNELSLLEAN